MYLVSRPGKLALPPFNRRDTLQCTTMGGTPYNGGDGWDMRENFPSDPETIWQTPPKDYLSGADTPDYWMWSPRQYNYYFGADTLFPDVVVGGERLSADLYPTNGRLSWGQSKFRYDVSDIWKTKEGWIDSPQLGYIYEKIKQSPNRGTLMSYYDSNSQVWWPDGWYFFDIEYFQLENNMTIEGYPKGAVLNHADLSSHISATFDWAGLCYGPMGNMEALGPSGRSRKLGIPIWYGAIRYPDPTGTRDTRMAGIPTFDQETKQFGMEFVFGIGNNLNYNDGWEMTHKYSTDLSGNAKDMRTIYYRGNSLSSGWFEFEAPTSLTVGSTIQLTNYISEGAAEHPQPVNATLELSGFAPFRSASIRAYTDPTESTRTTFESGMLLGVFNVGTMIY